MASAVVVHVPVHGHGAWAKELDAVHADVVGAGARFVDVVGVDGVDAGEGDVAATMKAVPIRGCG